MKLKYIILYFQTICIPLFEMNTLFENLSENVDYIEMKKIQFNFYTAVGIILKRHLESDYITVKYTVWTAKGYPVCTFQSIRLLSNASSRYSFSPMTAVESRGQFVCGVKNNKRTSGYLNFPGFACGLRFFFFQNDRAKLKIF